MNFCWEQTPSFNFLEISFHLHFGKIFTGYKILVWQYPERNCSIVSIMNTELVIRLPLLWGICQRKNSAFISNFSLGLWLSNFMTLIWAMSWYGLIFIYSVWEYLGFWVPASTDLHQFEKILSLCSFRWYLWSIFSLLLWDTN